MPWQTLASSAACRRNVEGAAALFSEEPGRDSFAAAGHSEGGSLLGRVKQLVGRKSLGRGVGHSRGQRGCPSLIVASLLVWVPLVGCSHSASPAYPTASQTSSMAPPSSPTAAAAIPAPPPPNEYEQARTSAYPSVTLADAIRNSSSSPPAPASTTAAPPSGSAAPSGAGPYGSAKASQTAATAAPPYGAAPASAAASPPPNEQDEALTAAYPSVSLSDIISGKAQ
jgi:hypothetical protein